MVHKLLLTYKQHHTAELLTDKDNFECADPGLVKEGPMACGEHQTPVGKLVRRQKIDYMTLMYILVSNVIFFSFTFIILLVGADLLLEKIM